MFRQWRSALLVAAGLLAVGAPAASAAPAGFPTLGPAGTYTVFALNGTGKQTANFSNDTVNGDVAVANGAKVTNQAPSTINGNVFVAAGAQFSGPGKVNGTLTGAANLDAARSAAVGASSQAAALPADVSYADVTTNTTVNGHSGLNVVGVAGDIKLSNASLTLAGPADAFFVVNVGGAVTLVGSGGIHVGGALPVGHLVVNLTGSG